MAKQIAQINPDGGAPALEIQFGDANVGVWRAFRWDSAGDAVQIGESLGPAAGLDGASISVEALVQSPKDGPDQPYSIRVLIRQDGATVPGGTITENGKLNPDGAKSFITFITFRHFL
jgi:hypothetical protein